MKGWVRKSLFGLHLFVLVGAVATLCYIWSGDFIVTTDSRRAYEQCEQEVARGCPLLYEYSSILEKENSRLNFALKECLKVEEQEVSPTNTSR